MNCFTRKTNGFTRKTLVARRQSGRNTPLRETNHFTVKQFVLCVKPFVLRVKEKILLYFNALFCA